MNACASPIWLLAGDGSAVDQQGRLYVATGKSVDVFTADGKFLGTIPGPQGLHGTFFGGKDRKTLFGTVFYGTWGTPSASHPVADSDAQAGVCHFWNPRPH
jgi:hypothetical protein